MSRGRSPPLSMLSVKRIKKAGRNRVRRATSSTRTKGLMRGWAELKAKLWGHSRKGSRDPSARWEVLWHPRSALCWRPTRRKRGAGAACYRSELPGTASACGHHALGALLGAAGLCGHRAVPQIAGLGRTLRRCAAAIPGGWPSVCSLRPSRRRGALFRGVFRPRGAMGWRIGDEITSRRVATNVATAGAGGIALSVWALRAAGLSAAEVASRDGVL